jgi:Arc/MetJ family transcription regulator
MTRIRTNIELDEGYVHAIMDRYGVHTKTEAVNLALRHLAGDPMSRDEALRMRGAKAFADVPADVGPTVSRPVSRPASRPASRPV